MLKKKPIPSNLAFIHSSLAEDVYPLLMTIGYKNPNLHLDGAKEEEIATHYNKRLKFSIIDKAVKKKKGKKNA